MSKKMRKNLTARLNKPLSMRNLRRLGLSLPALLAAMPAAHAFQLYDGTSQGNNIEISLNITASYTGLYRVGKPTPILASSARNPTGYLGDSNFRHGLVGNVFSMLPVLDIKDGNAGMHFSGEYYINTVYLQGNQNNQPDPVTGIVSRHFSKETRHADGNNGRMLDAFVYDSWAFGNGQTLTVKAGQQTLFWGQSLFSTNGISGGQAAIDTISAQNLVNPQAQQVFLPVGQIVLTYQPNQTFTLQGYYQYQWIPYNLSGVGSYFSTSDATGPGSNNWLLPIAPGFNIPVTKTKALTPESQNGQFGASVQAQYGNYDLGLFVERYDAKTPSIATVVNLVPNPFYPEFSQVPFFPNGGTFHEIYVRDIWLYGASLSTTIGATNVAGEISVRTHNPLVTPGPSGTTLLGNAVPAFGISPYTGNANSDPHVPVGNTMTMIVNAIYGSPALRYDPGGITVTAEVEYDKLLGVTRYKQGLAPGRSNDAAEFNVTVEPAFFEVLPNLELQFPVSVQYNFAGSSRVLSTENNGTGSYSASIVATYRENWDASLNFVSYFGHASANPLLPRVSGSPDRTYVSLNLQHTF